MSEKFYVKAFSSRMRGKKASSPLRSDFSPFFAVVLYKLSIKVTCYRLNYVRSVSKGGQFWFAPRVRVECALIALFIQEARSFNAYRTGILSRRVQSFNNGLNPSLDSLFADFC